MYHSYPPHRPRPRSGYFLPFLSIIILGLIVVLVFQIVDYFQEKRIAALENKAAVDVTIGRAEMKIWGVPQWTAALDSSILNEGDALRTAPGSRVSLTLLNGSVIRLNSETEIELVSLKSRDGEDEAAVALRKGEIWLKRSQQQYVRADFSVTTPHIAVTTSGTVFDVAYATYESVHVLDGRVQVEVKVEDEGDSMRTAETVQVAMGQEVIIGPEILNDLKNKRSVDLLALLSDDFRDSDWYKWNRSEDAAPGSQVSVEQAVKQPPAPLASSSQPVAEEPPQEVISVLAPPLILSPKETERISKNGSFVISGTTSPHTEKIEVTTFIASKAESYILQRYTKGSTSWSYVVSREYGNVVPGGNRYSIVAIGKDGKRSDAISITLTYDKPKEPADLSAPVVLDFNDAQSNETTEDVVKVDGTIGKGIVKIFVNDFALTRYVPDSGVWLYYAKTMYDNLKEGENLYEVYGMDVEGNKTPVTKFSIVKRPKVEVQPAL